MAAVAVVMDGIEDRGGQHGQAVAIAVEMAGRGHRVCYLSRWPVSRRQERVEALLDAGVDVLTPRWVDVSRLRFRVTPDDRARVRRVLRSALRLPALRERAAEDFARIAVDLLRKWRDDLPAGEAVVLHVIARPSAQYLAGLRTIGAPIVFSEFGLLALYGLDVTTAPRLDVDAYTADTPDSAAELETIEQRSVTVVPCIAGFPDAIELAAERATTFMVANRLVDYKQTDIAVRAVASRGYELDVYGDGPEAATLHALVGELGAAGRIRMHGSTGRVGIREGLDATHAFISCSRLDGTPMSVLEAMSRGRPIVAFPLAGIRTLVDEDVEGLYFDGTPEGLASTLERLAREPGLAARLGEAARRRWEREFAPAALVSRYEAVYREVLNAGGSAT